MNDLDTRVRQAFDDVTAPDCVKRAALSYIESAAKSASPAPCAQIAEKATGLSPMKPECVKARRTRPRMLPLRRAAVALAACLALALVGVGGFSAYAQPVTFVGIDVNPSIELGVNRFGIVVEEKALNDDGRNLLDAVPLTGHAYGDALALLTQSAAFAPYAQEDSFVEISVVSDDDRQAETIRQQSDACLSALPCQGSCHAVDKDTRDAAASAGMGVGRYQAALELMELDPDVTLEECANLTMRQLRDRIAQAAGDTAGHDAAANSAGQGQGSGNGTGKGTGMHQHRGGEGHDAGRSS